MVSIILSTYNQPESLLLSLWGYDVQTYRGFEVLVADDGSEVSTKELIDRMKTEVNFPLRHVYQKDKGFRKCAILNKAIRKSLGDYLIFSDGDIIPRSDFVETHVKLREQGKFLSGGTVRLPENFLEIIGKKEILKGLCFDRKWLEENGLKPSYKNVKLSVYGWRAAWMNVLTPAGATWNGGNASGWKKDLVATAGFDQRMHYGGEDRELGERLERMGVKGKQIRYSAVTLHLNHPRSYVSTYGLQFNKKLRKENKKNKITCTEYGLENRLLSSGKYREVIE
ncbi:MAG: glycosyltransferase [Bacteroidales bacterium]|nr:glycosyltransferase [Bacteroidales bacterium]